MSPISDAEREAAKDLIIMILYQAHPKPVPSADLRAKFAELVQQHGSPSAALAHVKKTLKH
ncbi:hypothetical protein GOC14_07220 [Sinorhizobium meliloti]|nr:hypothetical protein [Sinorhizobium meliloti]